MAEKIRAATTRREPAIRDFFDLDYAVARHLVRLDDTELVDLVRQKLSVPGNEPVSLGLERVGVLRGQLETRLKPALRARDYDDFDLDRAFQRVLEITDHV